MITEISFKADEEGDIERVIHLINIAPKMQSVLGELVSNLRKITEWRIDADPEMSAQDTLDFIMERIHEEMEGVGLTERDLNE